MAEFKVGDIVYWGTLKGEVVTQNNNDSDSSIRVKLDSIFFPFHFYKDGRFFKNTPVVLSHFPYEMEMKKVEQVIQKDTPVWFRNSEKCTWYYGYYSHFKDGEHYVFCCSKNSKETQSFSRVNILTTENPLK